VRYIIDLNRISGEVVNVLTQMAVDLGFEPRSGQAKDYEISICCFSAKDTALRRKSKDWLAQNQIMCLSGAIFLSTDCFFSELALYKSS
jgi:hypothetical protein